jgi:pimeloyl-ACP methyl ester carboxylesterase
MRLLLVHGGLWEDMTAQRFWGRTGVRAGFEDLGVECVAPDRPARPVSWDEDQARLSESVGDGPLVVMGASNGCTGAVRVTLEARDRVKALILAWPATAGDTRIDAATRTGMTGLGAEDTVIDALLWGRTLRGVTDDDLRRLAGLPVALVPAPPESPSHRPETVAALRNLIPGARLLPPFPEPPRPDFPPHRDRLVSTLSDWLATVTD